MNFKGTLSKLVSSKGTLVTSYKAKGTLVNSHKAKGTLVINSYKGTVENFYKTKAQQKIPTKQRVENSKIPTK